MFYCFRPNCPFPLEFVEEAEWLPLLPSWPASKPPVPVVVVVAVSLFPALVGGAFSIAGTEEGRPQ